MTYFHRLSRTIHGVLVPGSWWELHGIDGMGLTTVSMKHMENIFDKPIHLFFEILQPQIVGQFGPPKKRKKLNIFNKKQLHILYKYKTSSSLTKINNCCSNHVFIQTLLKPQQIRYLSLFHKITVDSKFWTYYTSRISIKP